MCWVLQGSKNMIGGYGTPPNLVAGQSIIHFNILIPVYRSPY